jgi:glycerophosphoryl diester phosphodiesterase
VTASPPTKSTRPLLLAHRGAGRRAPENTLAAFDAALEYGCDGFEFDVRRTADGAAVLCHAPRLRGRVVASSTLAALQGPSRLLRRQPRLATLDQVLERYAGRAFLDIELKVAGLEQAVLEFLRRWPPQRGYVVSSFLPEVLEALAELRPGLPLGYVCKTQRTLALWRQMPGEYLIPHRRLASQPLLEAAHAAGKKVFVWTVNAAREMQRLGAWGADGIISDNVVGMQRAFPAAA